NNPCEDNGNVTITEDNAAYTAYKNCLKYADLAERKIANGEKLGITLKFLKNNMTMVRKKEPNADLSDICNRLQNIEGNASNAQDDKKYFEEQLYKIKRVYRDKDAEVYPESIGLEYPEWFLEKARDFNREEVLSKAKTSNDRKAKEIVEILNDFSAFLDRQGLDEYLMSLIDQDMSETSLTLLNKAKQVKEVAQTLKQIAGGNSGMDAVIAFADRKIGSSDNALADIYTSDFHKDYLNQMVLTKVPFKPGEESNIEINPVFKAGDAVYATVYLPCTVEEAVNDWRSGDRGATVGLVVENNNTKNNVNMRPESYESRNFLSAVATIPRTTKQQTYLQFVVIPNLDSDINTEIDADNISPVQYARAMSFESDRLRKFTVKAFFSGSREVSNFKLFTPLTIDLSFGKGPSYYKDVDRELSKIVIAKMPMPVAKIKDPGLESQILSEMLKQGYEEQYKKVYIQKGWQLFKPIGETAYKEMKATITYTREDGKCGWHMYSFRSYQTGNGWSDPQKWGGADLMGRIVCEKVN
ncbi:MAG: hypothetical protein AAF901_12710, partial [Bacteroidota bacterium]